MELVYDIPVPEPDLMMIMMILMMIIIIIIG